MNIFCRHNTLLSQKRRNTRFFGHQVRWTETATKYRHFHKCSQSMLAAYPVLKFSTSYGVPRLDIQRGTNPWFQTKWLNERRLALTRAGFHLRTNLSTHVCSTKNAADGENPANSTRHIWQKFINDESVGCNRGPPITSRLVFIDWRSKEKTTVKNNNSILIHSLIGLRFARVRVSGKNWSILSDFSDIFLKDILKRRILLEIGATLEYCIVNRRELRVKYQIEAE